MTEKDPVCGMMVDVDQAPAKSGYMGKRYPFCSLDCKEKFDADPASYALPGEQSPAQNATQDAERGESRRNGC